MPSTFSQGQNSVAQNQELLSRLKIIKINKLYMYLTLLSTIPKEEDDEDHKNDDDYDNP